MSAQQGKGNPARKDRVSAGTAYQKHQSFSAFQSPARDLGGVVARLRRFAAAPESRPADAYRRAILGRALRDLLEPPTGEGPRFELHPNVLEELARLEDQEFARYLFYRYRYEVFPQTRELDAYPPCLQVEPTSSCNYRCVFCYQTDSEFTGRQQGHMGTMALDLFQKLVDEAQGHVEALTLASRGEPTVAKELPAMLRYLTGKFLAAKINTNASLLTEKLCHAILETGLQTVVFSADAAAEPLYSELRVNGSLERVLERVRLFHDIRAKHYPKSRTITRVSGVQVSSSQSMESMTELWGDLVDQVAFVKYNPWENTYERPLSGEDRPCSDLWRRMFVWWDGRANPCDVDYKSLLSVGRAGTGGLPALWRSEAYEKLRSAHAGGRRAEVHPCQRCTVV